VNARVPEAPDLAVLDVVERQSLSLDFAARTIECVASAK